jgi:hypothetical protein
MNAMNWLGWARKYPIATIGAVMKSQSCMGAPLQGHQLESIVRSTAPVHHPDCRKKMRSW